MNNYDTMTIVELKKICKYKGIKGYSLLKRKELINIITSHVDIIIMDDTSNAYLKELTHKIPRDINRVVCILCHKVGHKYTSDNCCENNKLAFRIKQYYIRNTTGFNIKEISNNYGVSQSYLSSIIKTVDKYDIISGKQISIDDFIQFETCELCNINTYHIQNNKTWKDKNVCDICWCEYEDERNSLWDEIYKYFKQECNICGIKRTHIKQRFHYDHINMFNKNNNIFMMANNGCSVTDIKAELDKCQLLCIKCHTVITNIEINYGFTAVKIKLTKELNNDIITHDVYAHEYDKYFDLYQTKMLSLYKKIMKYNIPI